MEPDRTPPWGESWDGSPPRPKRNAASGSEWPWGAWEGYDIERLLNNAAAETANNLERQLVTGAEFQATVVDDETFKELLMPTGQETRITSPTGGAKGSKLARFDLIPWDAIKLLAEHYGRGTFKYDDRNWERGYKWGLSFAALQRHLIAHWNGDVYDLDPYLYGVDAEGVPLYSEDEIRAFPDEDKVLHIAAVMWHACCLTAFYLRGIGEDDRPCGQSPS